jgi:Oligosaccharide biosynthesis protein Alg14 like/Glycosyl transferase family 2
MTGATLSYAVVTPARDEAENLARLAQCLARQTVPPTTWIVVDNGSSDSTREVLDELAQTHAWIHGVSVPGEETAVRGAPIVRAFHAGLARLDLLPDVVVKVDADISMEPDYFERLLAAFEESPSLGMASGSAYELRGSAWRQIVTTRSSVWGAARAYRRDCLRDVTPLDEYMGWDGIDELKARARGWTTKTLLDLPFRHHRREGERDGARGLRGWAARGRAAHYMGYRAWYLGLRSLYHARRHPAALGMLWGFAGAALRRDRVCPDQEVRAFLRREQTIRSLPTRRRKAPTQTEIAEEQHADVILVCSAGGHLLQLWALRGAWEDLSRAWVVASFERSDVSSLLSGERVYFPHTPTARNLKNLVRNAALAYRLIRTCRPKVIVSTGAAVAVPFAWVGRLLGVRIVWVESLARTTKPSLSCRLVAPVADRVYVQWPSLTAEVPNSHFVGTVFSES